MARVIDIKCPTCSAPLPIAADAQTVTCRYCGGTSVVERGGKTVVPPTPGQGVVHIPTHSPLKMIMMTWAATSVLGAGGAAYYMVAAAPYVPSVASEGAPAAAAVPVPVPAGPAYTYNDKPMLADVNGDGVPDVVGKINEYNVGTWIAAFDGNDGKELWRTDLLSPDAADASARRGLVLGRVLSIDPLGKAQAYDLKNGNPLWTTLLGEQAQEICEGEGVIVVTTTDDVKHALDPATGKQSALPAKTPCKPVFSDRNEVTPGYRIVSWSRFDDYKLPGMHSVEDLSADSALVPSGPGLRFMFGTKSKGSRVSYVVAVDGRKVVWKSVVPGIDPLTTDVMSTQEAAYIDGILVMPYPLKGSLSGMRMTAFKAATGERLWDVPGLVENQVPYGMAITSERVFFASWSNLYALSLKTGGLLFKLGK